MILDSEKTRGDHKGGRPSMKKSSSPRITSIGSLRTQNIYKLRSGVKGF